MSEAKLKTDEAGGQADAVHTLGRQRVAAPAETQAEAQAQPTRRRARRHLFGVGAIALVTAALQAALGIQQFKQYYMGAYDLVIFDQGIRGYAHGQMPVSRLKDVHDAAQLIAGYPHAFSLLGDHFSPILALAAPLYWLWNSPVVLLIAQALLFGAAVPSVWAFTRRALVRVAPERYAVRAAYLIAFAFGISWPLQMASQAGFHEVGFFVVLSAVMIERYQAGRLGVAIGCALGLLLVKEDCGYVVAAFGLLLLLTGGRGDRRRKAAGALLVLGGVGVALAVERWWLPAFGGRPGFYWYYGQLGPNMPSAIWRIVTDPAYAFHLATHPADKVQTLLLLLWPLLFCCLLSPLSLLALPLVLERAFSSKPEHWRTDQHYNAFLAVILTTAAVDGAVRLWLLVGRWRARRGGERAEPAPRTAGRWALGWSFGVLACALLMVFQSPMPLGSVFFPNAWRDNGFTTAADRAVTEVPSGVCVEADNRIAPHLTSRTEVLLLDAVPRGCPWVVLQTATVSYPFSGPAVEQARAQWLVAHGYQLVFSSNQVFVYHRP